MESGSYFAGVPKEILKLEGHSEAVNAVTFNFDGKQIASGSSDRTIHIWDAHDGQSLMVLKGHTDAVCTLAFSRDGDRLLSGSDDHTARLWDTRTGNSLLQLKGHSDGVSGVAFIPDSRGIVTSSKDATVRIWDARPKDSLVKLKHSALVTCLGFSADSKLVVTGSMDGTARIWEASSGVSLQEFIKHDGPIFSVGLSPDGSQLVTSSADKIVRLWNVRTGSIQWQLTGHSGRVFCVCFSPDGKQVLTGGEDKSARLWNAQTGEVLRDFPGHSDSLSSVSFSADGERICTTAQNDKERIWDAKTGKELGGGRAWTEPVLFWTSPDGNIVVRTRDFRQLVLARPNTSCEEVEDCFANTSRSTTHHVAQYFAAKKSNDHFAANFHLDRILSNPAYRKPSPPFNSPRWLDQRHEESSDIRHMARALFHSPSVLRPFYDREAVLFLAAFGDRLALRLSAQDLLWSGRTGAKAILLLNECQIRRPLLSPPVEELLIAKAYIGMNNLADANRYYKAATDWLDRPRNPMRAANIVTHAINPWNAIGEAFKPIDDPRHNTFDWESWHECDVFRAEVEKVLFANRQ